MSHNPWMDTAYLFQNGVVKVIPLGAYTQWGSSDPRNAEYNLEVFANDHSCLDKWRNFQPNWSFRCIYGAGGMIMYC